MPEGDTLHKIARAIAPDLEGRTVARLRLRDAGDVTRLAGRRVTRVEAVGKHLLVHLAGGWVLRTHLGMWGSWHRYRPGEPWQRAAARALVELATEDWVFVCFDGAQVELVQPRPGRDDPGAAAAALPALARLGPDLLGPDVDLDEVVRRARRFAPGDTQLAIALLDQRIAAGIGNVYKSEVMFLRRLHPDAPVGGLDDAALAAIFRLARELLRHNLGTVRRETRTGGFSRLWVYGRAGRPCLRCGTPVASGKHGLQDRRTYWCPRCQAPPTR